MSAGMGDGLERHTLAEWRRLIGLRDYGREMTQQELAFLSGISISSIASYEHSARTPRAVTARQIARALGLISDQIVWSSDADDEGSESDRAAKLLREKQRLLAEENEERGDDGPKSEARHAMPVRAA